MAGNNYFQTPNPTVEEVKELISDYKFALSKCQTMDRHKRRGHTFGIFTWK